MTDESQALSLSTADRDQPWMRTAAELFREPVAFDEDSPVGAWLARRGVAAGPELFHNVQLSFSVDMGVVSLEPNSRGPTSFGNVIYTPQMQFDDWVVGTGYREHVSPQLRFPRGATVFPSLQRMPRQILFRFALHLATETTYCISFPPNRVMVMRIPSDSEGTSGNDVVHLDLAGRIQNHVAFRVLCKFCQARGLHECLCNDEFRSRVSPPSLRATNWYEYLAHAHRWCAGRVGTVHRVLPDGNLTRGVSIQSMDYSFRGSRLDELRRNFVERCWTVDCHSLAIDNVLSSDERSDQAPELLEPLSDAVQTLSLDVDEHSLVSLGPFSEGTNRRREAMAASDNAQVQDLHDESKRFLCQDCGMAFMYSFNLKRHRRTIHEKQIRYSCDECDAVFTQKQNLTRHKNGVHLGKKPFVCPTCGTAVSSQSNLDRHFRRKHVSQGPVT